MITKFVDFISFVVSIFYFTCEKHNEEVYTAIQTGLVEAGFAKRETEKIRLKYRKLKTRFKQVYLINIFSRV